MKYLVIVAALALVACSDPPFEDQAPSGAGASAAVVLPDYDPTLDRVLPRVQLE